MSNVESTVGQKRVKIRARVETGDGGSEHQERLKFDTDLVNPADTFKQTRVRKPGQSGWSRLRTRPRTMLNMIKGLLSSLCVVWEQTKHRLNLEPVLTCVQIWSGEEMHKNDG